MANEKLIKQTIIVFSAIFTRLVDPTFQFSKGGATTRTLAKFIERIEQTFGGVSPERIVDFCVCSAYNFKNQNSTTCSISAIFGPQSIERFRCQTRGNKFYQNQWLETAGISRAALLNLIKDRSVHPHAQYIYVPSEEPTKKRQLNRRTGYLLCQTATLGWSPYSPTCKQCNFKPECMKATETKYPEIYRLRIEHGTVSTK